MKRVLSFLLVLVMLLSTALADTLTIDLQTATDEELANALSLITAEQRARIKTEIVLTETDITLAKNKTVTIKGTIEGLPEDITASKLTWASSDKSIATVTGGKIKGVGAGSAVITCSATLSNGIEISADCKVTVTVAITGLTAAEKKLTLNVGKTAQAEITVKPKDATNTKLSYTSSDASVATVSSTGLIKAIGAGKCTITAQSADGSNKKATITVTVPYLYTPTPEVTITSKDGGSIVIYYYNTSMKDIAITESRSGYGWWSYEASYVLASKCWKIKMDILPLKAGSYTLTIKDKSDSSRKLAIKITIAHSAVYDSTSYPKINYDSAARYPSSYKGDNVSFSGKVQQVIDGYNYTAYRISSRGNYDDVVYVILDDADETVPILEDDKVTVYGTYDGNYTYETIFGAEVTIPKVNAERINLK